MEGTIKGGCEGEVRGAEEGLNDRKSRSDKIPNFKEGLNSLPKRQARILAACCFLFYATTCKGVHTSLICVRERKIELK